MTNKQTYSYVGISFIILLFGFWVVPKVVDKFKDASNDLVIIGKAPEFIFIDQDKNQITEKTYENKVYLVEFFFTSCPGICITMNKNMMEIQDAFFGNPNFGIASISIDPKIDTPKKLKAYSQKHKAGKNWHFLTGEKDNIYKTAYQGFNIYVSETPGETSNGGFEHSGMFALIDQNGNIRSRKDKFENPIIYYDGTNHDDIKKLKEDIQKLLN